MRLVDSHCHLDDERFDVDREQAIGRARAAGVATMVAVGTGKGPPDLEAGLRLAETLDGVYATVGVHPHDAAKADDGCWGRLRELCGHPKTVAFGEIGLDYHYNFSPPAVQKAVFARQLDLAAAAGLPVVIHTREAWDDTLAMLREYASSSVAGGILHCFPGGPSEAEQALALGFHISFAGIVTFPKATPLHEAARIVPQDRLLIETDAPYLAPVPLRGRRNEPAFLVHTARRLAELRGVAPEEIAETTTANFERLCLRRESPDR